MRHFSFFSTALGLVASLSLFGCSSDDKPAGATCSGYDYSNYTPGATMYTLATDIQPLFSQSCALSMACHQTGSTHPPDLGPLTGTTPDATMLATIATSVRAASTEATGKSIVVPTKPQDSYMMNKVEDNLCMLSCMGTTTPPCGVKMPQVGDPLPAADQAKLRDWIAQGAK